MRTIEITPLSNGAHRNQSGLISKVPSGWAVIPSDMVIPETFPFVDIVVEGGVVTEMTPGVVPEPEPMPTPEPGTDDILNALLGVTSDE